MDKSAVLLAANRVADGQPGGRKGLWVAMGEPGSYTSFCHALDAQGSAKLGLDQAFAMARASGNLDVLRTWAAEFGLMLLPMPEAQSAQGEALMQHVADCVQRFGAFAADVTQAVADGDVTRNELSKAQVLVADLQAAQAALLVAMTAAHAAGKPVFARGG